MRRGPHHAGEHVVDLGPGRGGLGRELGAEPLLQRPQQRRANDVVVLVPDAVAGVAPAERLHDRDDHREPSAWCTATCSTLISFRPCSRMSPRNRGRSAGSSAKSRP